MTLLGVAYKHGLNKKMKIASYFSSPNLGKTSKAGNVKLFYFFNPFCVFRSRQK